MKKLYMRTIIGSSGRYCVFIYFNFTAKAGLFESHLFWVGQYDPPQPSS